MSPRRLRDRGVEAVPVGVIAVGIRWPPATGVKGSPGPKRSMFLANLWIDPDRRVLAFLGTASATVPSLSSMVVLTDRRLSASYGSHDRPFPPCGNSRKRVNGAAGAPAMRFFMEETS